MGKKFLAILLVLIAVVAGVAVPRAAEAAPAGDFVLTLKASDLGVDLAVMRQVVPQIQTEIAQAGGLSDAIKQTMTTYQVSDVIVDTSEWADFDGTVTMSADGMVLTVPASEISTSATYWQSFAAMVAGALAGYGLRMLCMGILAATGVGAATIPLVCTPLGGAVTGLIQAVIVHGIDGDLGTPSANVDIVVKTLAGAVSGAVWETWLSPFAKSYLPGAFKSIGNWLVARAPTIASWFGITASEAMEAAGEIWIEMEPLLGPAVTRFGTTSAVGLRVMPLGDSITYGVGSSNGSGYRGPLWSLMARDAGGVEFVGSQHSGPAPDANEGHSGWLISGIAGIADSALATYRPNVVLLHIGTNDMGNNVDPGGAPGRLGSLIDQILRAAPEVTLIVSTIVPAGDAATQARIVAFNRAVPGVVASRRAAGKHVALVGMNAVSTADLADSLHPNDAGYQKMAAAFYRGVAGAAYDGWIKPPAPGGGGPGGGPVQGWFPQGVVATGTMSAGSYPGTLNLAATDQVQYADINGDGRADFLVNHQDGTVSSWLNAGTGTDGGVTWQSRGTSGPTSFNALWQFADFDADGKADLIQINKDSGQAVVYWNNGSTWGNIGRVFPTAGQPSVASGSQIRFADLNGDGKADYLAVAPDSSVRAWLNVGWGTSDYVWTSLGVIATGVGDPGDQIRFADVNGDGRADYLDVAPNGSVQAWFNGGAGGSGYLWLPQGTIATGVGSPAGQIRFADLNADRKADYLDVGAGGATRLWINGGGGLWFPQGSITTGNSSKIVYADLDGDRKADYLQVNADSSVQAWMNGGPGGSGMLWFPKGTVATGVGAAGGNVRFADLNGDGRADYLVVNPDSSVQAWMNGGPGGNGWLWFPQGTVATGVGDPGSQIQFADLNGDGRADYLDVAPNSSVRAWMNGGPGGDNWLWFPQGTVADGVGAPGGQIRFAPLYGTARADYLVLGDDSAVQVWQNGGPGGNNWLWFPGGQVASGVQVAGSRIQFADLNGDWRADYLDVDPATGATRLWINAG